MTLPALVDELGRLGVKLGPDFNATGFIFLMKNLSGRRSTAIARIIDHAEPMTVLSSKSCAPLTSPASPTPARHCGSSSSSAPASLSPRRRRLSTEHGMAARLLR